MNSRYEAFKVLNEALKKSFPALWKLVFPRHYVPPQGWANPQMAATSLGLQLQLGSMLTPGNPMFNKTKVDCVLISWKLVELGVPTYFVGQDFVSALAMSDPPEDMPLNDLNWPHDAMVFMLPEKFQDQYFGRAVPFIAIAKQQAGMFIKAPPRVKAVFPDTRDYKIENASKEDAYIFYSTVFFDCNSPIDYAGSFCMADTVGKINANPGFWDETHDLIPSAAKNTPEEDKEILLKIFSCSLMLMLAMNAEPQWLEPATVTCSRKRGKNDGDWDRDLWSPNFLGRRYILPREPLGGTHASPRLHRKRGHLKRVVHGPHGSLRDMRWIKPHWVGIKNEIEA